MGIRNDSAVKLLKNSPGVMPNVSAPAPTKGGPLDTLRGKLEELSFSHEVNRGSRETLQIEITRDEMGALEKRVRLLVDRDGLKPIGDAYQVSELFEREHRTCGVMLNELEYAKPIGGWELHCVWSELGEDELQSSPGSIYFAKDPNNPAITLLSLGFDWQELRELHPDGYEDFLRSLREFLMDLAGNAR